MISLKSITLLYLIVATRCAFVLYKNIQKAQHIKNFCPKSKNCEEGSHIMCHSNQKPIPWKGPACELSGNVKTSKVFQTQLLSLINNMRRNVASGRETGKNNEKLPKAFGMQELQWDDELARFAQVYATQCTLNHDLCRATKRFPQPAQIAGLLRFSHPNWKNPKLVEKNPSNKLTGEKILFTMEDIVNNAYSLKKFVTKENILKYSESGQDDDISGPRIFFIFVNGKSTHVGCGLQQYADYYGENRKTEFHIHVLEMVCNFASEPIVGKPVYETKRPKNTSECGCLPGFVEDKDCICQKLPEKKTTTKKPQNTTITTTKTTTSTTKTPITTTKTAPETTTQSSTESTTKPTTETTTKPTTTTKNTTETTTKATPEATTESSTESSTKPTTETTTNPTTATKNTTETTNTSTTITTPKITTESSTESPTEPTTETTTKSTTTTKNTTEPTTKTTPEATTESSTESSTKSTTETTTKPTTATKNTTETTNTSTTKTTPETTTESSTEPTTEKTKPATKHTEPVVDYCPKNTKKCLPAVLLLPIFRIDDAPPDKLYSPETLRNTNQTDLALAHDLIESITQLNASELKTNNDLGHDKYENSEKWPIPPKNRDNRYTTDLTSDVSWISYVTPAEKFSTTKYESCTEKPTNKLLVHDKRKDYWGSSPKIDFNKINVPSLYLKGKKSGGSLKSQYYSKKTTAKFNYIQELMYFVVPKSRKLELLNQSKSESFKKNTYKENVNKESVKSKMKTPEFSEDVNEESLINKMKKSELSVDVNEESLKNKMKKHELSEDVNLESLINEMKKSELSVDVNEESLKNKMKKSELREDVNEESLKNKMKKPELSEDVNEESLKNEMNKPELSEEVNEESLKNEMNKPELSEEVNEESLKNKMKKPELSEDVGNLVRNIYSNVVRNETFNLKSERTNIPDDLINYLEMKKSKNHNLNVKQNVLNLDRENGNILGQESLPQYLKPERNKILDDLMNYVQKYTTRNKSFIRDQYEDTFGHESTLPYQHTPYIHNTFTPKRDKIFHDFMNHLKKKKVLNKSWNRDQHVLSMNRDSEDIFSYESTPQYFTSEHNKILDDLITYLEKGTRNEKFFNTDQDILNLYNEYEDIFGHQSTSQYLTSRPNELLNNFNNHIENKETNDRSLNKDKHILRMDRKIRDIRGHQSTPQYLTSKHNEILGNLMNHLEKKKENDKSLNKDEHVLSMNREIEDIFGYGSTPRYFTSEHNQILYDLVSHLEKRKKNDKFFKGAQNVLSLKRSQYLTPRRNELLNNLNNNLENKKTNDPSLNRDKHVLRMAHKSKDLLGHQSTPEYSISKRNEILDNLMKHLEKEKENDKSLNRDEHVLSVNREIEDMFGYGSTPQYLTSDHNDILDNLINIIENKKTNDKSLNRDQHALSMDRENKNTLRHKLKSQHLKSKQADIPNHFTKHLEKKTFNRYQHILNLVSEKKNIFGRKPQYFKFKRTDTPDDVINQIEQKISNDPSLNSEIQNIFGQESTPETDLLLHRNQGAAVSSPGESNYLLPYRNTNIQKRLIKLLESQKSNTLSFIKDQPVQRMGRKKKNIFGRKLTPQYLTSEHTDTPDDFINYLKTKTSNHVPTLFREKKNIFGRKPTPSPIRRSNLVSKSNQKALSSFGRPNYKPLMRKLNTLTTGTGNYDSLLKNIHKRYSKDNQLSDNLKRLNEYHNLGKNNKLHDKPYMSAINQMKRRKYNFKKYDAKKRLLNMLSNDQQNKLKQDKRIKQPLLNLRVGQLKTLGGSTGDL